MTEQQDQEPYPQEEEYQQEEENPEYYNEQNENEYENDQNYENYENIQQNVQTTKSKIQSIPSGYSKTREVITKKVYEYPSNYQTNKRSFSQTNETYTYKTNNYNQQNQNFNDMSNNINYQINRYTPDRENDSKLYYKNNNKKNYKFYVSGVGYVDDNQKVKRVKSANIIDKNLQYSRGYSGNVAQRRNYNYYESSNCYKKRQNSEDQNNYSYDQPKIMSTIQKVTQLHEGKKNYDDFMKNLRNEQNKEEINYENSDNYNYNSDYNDYNNYYRKHYSYQNLNSNNNNINANRQYKYQIINSNNNYNNIYENQQSNNENNNYQSYQKSYKYKQTSIPNRPLNYRSDFRAEQSTARLNFPNKNIKVNTYDERYFDPEKYTQEFIETQQVENGRIEKKTKTTLSKDAQYLISVSSAKKIYDNNENDKYGQKEITNENEEEIYEVPEKNIQEITTTLHTRPINLGDNYKYYESKYIISPNKNYRSVTTHRRRGEMEIMGSEQYETQEVRNYKIQPQIRNVKKVEKQIVREQYGDEGYDDNNEDNVNFEYGNENNENLEGDNYYYVSGEEYYNSPRNRY